MMKEKMTRETMMKEKNISPGAEYVAAYLQDNNGYDPSWIAESINAGDIIACPRCHFLSLPTRPFPLRRAEYCPADDCDVCAAIPLYLDPIYWAAGEGSLIPTAAADVADERVRRAITLYELWIQAANAADALRLLSVKQAMQQMFHASGAKGPMPTYL